MKRNTCKSISDSICPNCGNFIFVQLYETKGFKCYTCNEVIECKENEKSFLSSTDSDTIKMLIRLGYDMLEAALKSNIVKNVIVGAATTLGLTSIPVIGAFSFLLAKVPGILKEITGNKLFTERTVQKQFEMLFTKHLNRALKAGANVSDLKYYQFRLYFEKCRRISSVIVDKLVKENKKVNFFDEETIAYIYGFYTDNPTTEELDNIIEVSKEIQLGYINDIQNNEKLKDAYNKLISLNNEKEILEYLMKNAIWVEEKINENSKKLDSCIDLIKKMSISADNTDYITTYSNHLFLEEEGSRLTLGGIYIDPSVDGEDKKASNIINEWYKNDTKHPTMLMLGAAGIGKSSLCSKIIADAGGLVPNNKKLFDIPLEKIHIKALRGCRSIIEDFKYNTITELIEKIFATNSNFIECDNDLFILDGLDELAIISTDSCVKYLVSKLKNFNTKKYKLLITSRESSTFDSIQQNEHLLLKTLTWKFEDINEWCNQYSESKNSVDSFIWCEKFLPFYKQLDDNDRRREVFQIPIILYISAERKIDFSVDSSICQIYNQAFRCLLEREHIKESEGAEALENDKELFRRKFFWQYTKELAYQMALSEELVIPYNEENIDSRIENARKMTSSIIGKKYGNMFENTDFSLDNTEFLSVFQFAKSEDYKKKIVFVHKTVYEYFAAVKLYEDYFKNLTTNSSIEDVWKNIVGAFRYRMFEYVIIEHLADLMTELGTKVIDCMYKNFLYGLSVYEIYQQFNLDEIINEYNAKGKLLISLKTVFSNLLKLLSALGYKNTIYAELNKNRPSEKQEAFDYCFRNLLMLYINSDYDFSYWYFKDMNFTGVELSNCRFDHSELSYAKMNGILIDNKKSNTKKGEFKPGFNNAIMVHCKLCGIKCRYVDFSKANLEGALIRGSDFYYSFFNNSNLRRTDLAGSIFSKSSFKNSIMIEASLRGAVLLDTSFENVDLRGADLRGIVIKNSTREKMFRNAMYNTDNTRNKRITFFPKDFNPKANGMIVNNEPY